MKIKPINIVFYMMFFAIFKPYLLIPQGIQQLLKAVCFVVILLYLFIHIHYKKLLNNSLVFCLSILASGFYSHLSGISGYQNIILNSILQALGIYEMYTFLLYCHDRNYMSKIFECLYKITGFYCVTSLISMVALGNSSHGTEITYLWGNKFATGYFFIAFTAFFLIKNFMKIKKYIRYKLLYFALVILLILINRWLYCTTTMLASIVFLIALFIPDRIKGLVVKPQTILATILISVLIVLCFNWILSNSYIQYLVSQVLGKSHTLTGRLRIYSFLQSILSKRVFLGYGYGNMAIEEVVGYGNAQNGLMQIMINYGLIGILAFFWTVYYCFKHTARSMTLLPMYLIIYALIVSSIVEVSYNNLFFLVLFFIRWNAD